MSDPRSLLALTLGDPAGIGPEVSLAAARDAEVRAAADLLLIGPASLRPPQIASLGADPAELTRAELGARVTGLGGQAWAPSAAAETWQIGRPQASAGRAALAALRMGAELAHARRVDALVTAPVSKEALHLAGERVEGQTELLARWSGARECEMLAVADRMRVLLLTRHMPLRAALERISTELVLQRLRLLQRGLVELGWPRPHLALAGLNPHAGEAGILGSEEQELLAPAVQRARTEGIDVSDPQPPDTVFLRAARGDYDAVLALYHDQAFIPAKLHAPERGMTLLLGLPYLRVSPAHGTAFDIAGQGRARSENLRAALLQAQAWAQQRVRAQ